MTLDAPKPDPRKRESYRRILPEHRLSVINDLLEAYDYIDDLEAEIKRHHEDFERWEEMASRGVSRTVDIGTLSIARHLLKRVVEDFEEVRILRGSTLVDIQDFVNGKYDASPNSN